MTTLQYQLSRMTERKKKLMTQGSARTDGSEPTFCLSPKMDPASYSNAFNNYLIKLKDSEYKSKNPKMFIWNQKMQYMNKLNLPSQLLNPPRNSSAFSSIRGGQQNDQNQDRVRSSKPLLRSNTRHLPRDYIKTEPSTVESETPIYTATPKMRRPQKNLELDLNTLHSFYTTTQYSSKSTYPTTKVQTELLSNRFSPQLQNIPNFKYMLNPFDRKNLPLNKALSQMNTDNELLNREEIEQETLSKIAYVSKHHKLRRILKPKVNRPKIIIAKTEPARQSPFIRLNSMNMNDTISRTRSSPKHDVLITEPSSRRFNESPPLLLFSNADEVKIKSAKLVRKDRKTNTTIQRERSFRDQDSSPRNKGDSRLVKFPEKEKSLVQNVESGLHYFEELSSLRELESKENRLHPHHQGHEKKKSLKQSISKDKTKEDEHIRMLTDEVGDDNIYFFGKYFKKRYMENGVRFDVSPSLQSRIKALNHGLKHSIRTIDSIDFRDECA